MDSEAIKLKIQEIDAATGTDINNMPAICNLQKELLVTKDLLENTLKVNKGAPTQFSDMLEKAEKKSKEIEEITVKYDEYLNKVKGFLNKCEPLRSELEKRYQVLDKFDNIIAYLKSYEQVDELSKKLKNTSDEEEAVQLFGELKTISLSYKLGHRAVYIKESLHYWHSILKENFSVQYEEVLKSIKWPITSSAENYNPPREAINNFNNLTKNLLLIQEPRDSSVNTLEQDPSLPIKFLLQPLKKRFTFHFMGSRETARIDRPEWFLTQTLTWIKDHSEFLKKNVQPIVDKLEMDDVKVENEFNAGLVLLASERLHTVLGLLLNSTSPTIDPDASFAHAIDETLGFHNELVELTGMKSNSVLSVLTRAETLVRWLAVEKKYALCKIEECLSGNCWMEPVADSKGSDGAELWVPRAADWFISLLQTVEDRYVMLPQPGHRLQFLELQQELVEEWRIRLTQLLAASLASLHENTFSNDYSTSSPNALPAIVNAAHHSRLVLLQWANSLHYLQLYYYRRQFEEFTHQQHSDDFRPTTNAHQIKSVQEVEERANTLATQEATRRNSDSFEFDLRSPSSESEEGVWGDAPDLLLRLRDNGLDSLSDHILLEFKASIKSYRRERWHSMPQVEQMGLSISASLCRPLAGICSRLHRVTARLAPALATKLQAHVADQVDLFFFEEVVLTNNWNSGGIAQFKYDVERYLIPVFTTEHNTNPLPRLADACTVLDMDYEQSRHLDDYITRYDETRHLMLLHKRNIKKISPLDVQRLFEQRKDLGEANNLVEYDVHCDRPTRSGQSM